MFSSFFTYLLTYKYTALIGIVFTSSLIGFVPLNEVILIAGALANLGYMNILLVLTISFSMNVLADLFAYGLTYRFGDAILSALKIKKDDNFFRVKGYLERYAYGTIYVSKIVGPFGPSVNLIAGLIRIPFSQFLIFDLLGNATDVLFFVLAGYLAGNYWQKLIANLWVIALIAAFCFLVYLVYKTRKRNQK